MGETGNEKKVEHQLDAEELGYLLLLAWNAKFGWKFPVEVNSTISLQKLGWVEVHESDLIDKLITIQDKLNSSEYKLLESYDRHWFRFSVDPMCIYFNEQYFSYKLVIPSVDQYELRLQFDPIKTEIGNIPEHTKICQLKSKRRYLYLKSLNDPNIDAEIVEMREIRNFLDPQTRDFGLRKFIREEEKIQRIVCSPT